MRLLVSSTPKIMPSLLGEFSPWLGVLVTPSNGALANARRTGLPWAADNEAFSSFDPAGFRAMLSRLKGVPGCLWVACPDVVGDAAATLARFREWKDEVREASGQPLALVGQDGMEDEDLPWGEFDALFVGGSTAWKLSSAARQLVAEALRRGKAAHMGRANSRRRYETAAAWGCQTVDGTNVCKWPDVWLPRCVRWLRAIDEQGGLWPQ